jgi:hypothetical protein
MSCGKMCLKKPASEAQQGRNTSQGVSETDSVSLMSESSLQKHAKLAMPERKQSENRRI